MAEKKPIEALILANHLALTVANHMIEALSALLLAAEAPQRVFKSVFNPLEAHQRVLKAVMRVPYHFPDDGRFARLTFNLDVAASLLMLDDNFSRGNKSAVGGGLASDALCIQALSLVMLDQGRLGENAFTLKAEEARDGWSRIIREIQGF